MYDTMAGVWGNTLSTIYQRENGKRKRNKRRKRRLFLSVVLTLGICAASILAALHADVPAERSEEQKLAEAMAQPGQEQPGAAELVLEDVTQEPEEYVVMLDAGHGGMDEGCTGDNVLEKEVNLAITRLVQSRLEELGYRVVLTRTGDGYLTKEQRVELSVQQQPDIFVSIHQNTCEEKEVCGLETWYYGADTSRDSRRLARLIHQETLRSAGAAERELRDDAEYCVTGQTAMPACLIETGFLSNSDERLQLADPVYQDKLAAGIAAGIDLFFRPKTMYLTFDDGPSADYTAAILDILKKHNIQATFFVVGENVRKYPEVAKRIAAEGHTIGIHCNRHDYNELYQSTDSYLADYEEAYRAVLEVTGVEAKLFRFPGGSINSHNEPVRDAIIQEMTDRGFVYFDWNGSLEDAVSVQEAQPEELIRNALETSLDRKRVVLLAHDVKYSTAQCLEGLLDAFPAYRMEALTPDTEPVQFH